MAKQPTPDVLEYIYLHAIENCEVLKSDIQRYKRKAEKFPTKRSYGWLKGIVKNYVVRIKRRENNALYTAWIKKLG